MCWNCFGVELQKDPTVPYELQAYGARFVLARAMQMGSQYVSVEPTREGIRINFDKLRNE